MSEGKTDNLNRTETIGQILLDLNIAPYELNSLIIDYQKPEKTSVIGKIMVTDNSKGLAIDDEYIYTIENNIMNIFGKYNFATIKEFPLINIKGDIINFIIHNNLIYILTNHDENSDIVTFDKSGNFIKSITINSKLLAFAMDEKDIYVTDTKKIYTINKKM